MEEVELTFSDKVNEFFVHYRKILLTILAIVLVAVVVVIGFVVYLDNQKKVAIKNIETAITDFQKFKTDNIKNAMDSLTDEEKKLLAEEEEKLIEKLAKYSDEKNYGGFMAIQQIGDIYFKNGEFEKALSFYEKAPLSENKYPSGALFFNVASCADELGKNEMAIEFFVKASESEDFPFKGRALFNVARIQENSDMKKAIETYNKVIATYPETEWAKLSKTRIIELELN